MKKNLYFNEYNLLMGSGGIVYLPLVSGILSAYIKTSKIIRDNIEVHNFIFEPDTVNNLMKKYDSPDIATFSIAMWNEQLSLAVAKKIKSKGINLVLIEQTHSSSNIYASDYNFPLCFIVGNEVEGVSEELANLANTHVELPMRGIKQSLNVSVATGIVGYELSRCYTLKQEEEYVKS